MKAAALLLALPALLAGCLAGEPAVPAVPMGQIDGAVVDHLLHPFADQSVQLVQLGRIDRTSPLGGFTFRDVPVGFYTLTTSLPDGASSTQVVDVEAGKITRVILQVLPLPLRLTYFQAVPFHAADEAKAGAVCEPCSWSVALDADHPAEVTLEARWSVGPLVGKDYDLLDIVVTDDRGFPLYEGREVSSPLTLSIDGADIHPDARELRVDVRYGAQFLPSRTFTMDSVVTLYHGATKAQMFFV